jgi:diguanylate cyclase (GGDEF)-like protein/PAS domain S-box-containing protein
MEHKKETEDKLRKLLKKLRTDIASQKHFSVIQRILHELRIYQVEQELKSLEFEETRRQLTEARDRYAELYDFAPIAYITFDNQAHITDLNHAAAKLFGQERELILNKPISHWLPEENSQDFIQHLFQVSFSRRKVSTEIKLRRLDQKLVCVRLESIAIRDEDGVATRCQTAIIDITERKKAEEILRSAKNNLEARVDERTSQLARTNRALQDKIEQHTLANEKLKQVSIVFDNTEDGILITDANFNIINVNRSFCEMTGYSIDELMGRNPRTLVTSRTDDKYYQVMLEALREHGRWKGEIWYQNKKGEHIPVWKNINTVNDENHNLSHYVAIVTDITALKETENRLEHLAHHDVLTGLPNRLHFMANLEQALKRTMRRKRRLALLLLDLDKFKEVNDTMGHAIGDTLLKIVAERLQDTVRHEDTVARLGGDEFTVILEDITLFEDAGFIAEKILAAIAEPTRIEGREVITQTSIGISVFPDDSEDIEELTRQADAAMYRAKENGGNGYAFYTRELSKRAAAQLALESQLRKALREGEFEVYYQPQITLSSDRVVGMEALIRWNHPQDGLLTPDKFMPVAEDSGLVDEIDEWVLNTACCQVNQWQKAGRAPIRISINLAGRTLAHNGCIVDKVKNALQKSGLQASSLELDIPEQILQGEHNLQTLQALKALGVTLSVDDFGKGLSSLSTLKDLPIDAIKIDRSFVSAIPGNPADVALAAAIIAMGHNLKLKVTAAGVGNLEQLTFFRDQGCDEMQGFYFSEPIPCERALSFMEKNTLH